MQNEARLCLLMVREIKEAGFEEVKPSLIASARKFLENYPFPGDPDLEHAMGKLRRVLDEYTGWVLEGDGVTAAAIEQARILIQDGADAASARGVRASVPLSERERSLLRLVTPTKNDDDDETSATSAQRRSDPGTLEDDPDVGFARSAR